MSLTMNILHKSFEAFSAFLFCYERKCFGPQPIPNTVHSLEHVHARLRIILTLFEVKQHEGGEKKIKLRQTVLSVSDVSGMDEQFIC